MPHVANRSWGQCLISGNLEIGYKKTICSAVRCMVVIAVVDDEESVRKAVIRLLQAAGYTAHGFASGRDFLQNGLVDWPDCLVLDLQMPGLSGQDVQRQLHCVGAHLPRRIDHSSRRAQCARGVLARRRDRLPSQACRPTRAAGCCEARRSLKLVRTRRLGIFSARSANKGST